MPRGIWLLKYNTFTLHEVSR